MQGERQDVDFPVAEKNDVLKMNTSSVLLYSIISFAYLGRESHKHLSSYIPPPTGL